MKLYISKIILYLFVGFEVFTGVTMKNAVFCICLFHAYFESYLIGSNTIKPKLKRGFYSAVF
jgi:hypothetical protein